MEERRWLTTPVTYAIKRAQLLFCMTNQHGSCGAPPIADEYFGQTAICGWIKQESGSLPVSRCCC